MIASVAVCMLAGCGGGSAGGSGSDAISPESVSVSRAPATATATATATAAAAAATPTSAATSAPIIIVGSTTVSIPGATHYAQLADVPWATLTPGTTVEIAAGNYAGAFTITSQGTAASPIKIVAIDPSHPPVMTTSVDFQHAAWVQLSNIVVQSPTFPGVVIRLGSNHLVVSDSLINQAPIGIVVTNGAGTAISLLRNRINSSTTDGIGIDGINADPADPSIIQGNVVQGSGYHGMEIRGSNYVIEHNETSFSGQTIGGTSGIHLYSALEGDGTCANNIVRYNLSHENADVQASDGNGIQADRWCDGNTIAFNVAWSNDGAGISVYDGNNNQIYANTLVGNSVDPRLTHGSLGQIVVNSSTVGGPRPAGNHVYDNILVSTLTRVPALYVDSNAVALGSNRTSPNLLFNTGGGTLLRWTDAKFLTALGDIAAATGSTGNLLTAPAFANVTQPQADGWRLTASPGPGSVALTGQVDRLGKTGVAADSFFGAYFFGP